MPRVHTDPTLLVRDLAGTDPFGQEAFTIEMLAVAVPTVAAAPRLVGSVPDARAGSPPAGSAT